MPSVKIAVLVPCFNVSGALQNLFTRLSPKIIEEISEFVLLDNASVDDTLEKARAIRAALGAKVTIFSNKKNYGYGGNIKIGFDYCLSRGFQYIAIMHGDDQGNSDVLLSKFVEMTNTLHPDLIVGSRFIQGSNISGYSKFRTLGNLVFNRLTFAITGVQMSDAGAGIICVKATTLSKIPYRSLTNGFQFHPQLNLFFYDRNDIHIEELAMTWTDSVAPSSIRLFNYALTLLRHLILYRYRRLCGAQPHQYFFDPLAETRFETTLID